MRTRAVLRTLAVLRMWACVQGMLRGVEQSKAEQVCTCRAPWVVAAGGQGPRRRSSVAETGYSTIVDYPMCTGVLSVGASLPPRTSASTTAPATTRNAAPHAKPTWKLCTIASTCSVGVGAWLVA